MDNQGRSESSCDRGDCPQPQAADRLTEIKQERGKVYGEPKFNHKLIAGHWAGLLAPWWERISKGEPLPPHVVANMMDALKLNRKRLVFHRDNYDDSAVYAGFAREWQEEYDKNGGDGMTPASEREYAPGMRPEPKIMDTSLTATQQQQVLDRLKDWQDLVFDFHNHFGHGVGFSLDNFELRERLLDEEFGELMDEVLMLRRHKDERESVPRVAKTAGEMADVIYVVLGLAVELGVDIDPIFRAIHAKNMEKIPNRNGKPKKPDGWKPVDLERMVWDQWRVKS